MAQVKRMSVKDLEKLEPEDIEKYIQALAEEKEELRGEQITAHEVLDRKNAEADALRRLETMSKPEIEALVQRVQTHGIPSEEKVNG